MDYELLIDAVNDLNREFTIGDTIDEYKLIGDFYFICSDFGMNEKNIETLMGLLSIGYRLGYNTGHRNGMRIIKDIYSKKES